MSAAEITLTWDARAAKGTVPDLRAMLAGNTVRELRIRWTPRIAGGRKAGTVTGLDHDFLPHGIRLELMGLRRAGADCIARYRIRRPVR